MKAFFNLAAALGLAAGVLGAPVDSTTTDDSNSTDVSSYDLNCKVVTFTVNGTGQNRNLTGSIPVDSLEALREFASAAPLVNISGPQTLAGTYCTPYYVNQNSGKLQVFFQSITGSRATWSAQGGIGTGYPPYKPEQYSWVRFANALGYPTLTIDRLGNGNSSHPDPILVVQAPYEMALYNDLANQLRAGAKQLGRAYNFLIYVGNSYGSQLGAGIAGFYPKAYDEYVLTGFSKDVQQDFVGVSMIIPEPAAVHNPAKFGTLSPGYVTASSQIGRTNSFFGSKQQVDFEDEVAQLFYDREDVVSLGQFVSVYAGVFDGTGFTGRVFTLTGEQDQAFCGPGSPVIGPAGCGPLLQETGVLFPNADYNWKSVNRTGHAIQLHLSSQKVFTIAHQFLAGQEFRGGPPA